MKKIFIAALIVPLVLSGCASVKKDSTVMHGMFVNGSNIPVPGVEIYDQDLFCARSNSNGFFELEVPSETNLDITAVKSGWEKTRIKESFVDSTKLYVYQIRSLEKVYADIEKKLIENNYQAAFPLIEDLDKKYGDTETAFFLKSIIAYKSGDYEGAYQLLLESGMNLEDNYYAKKLNEKIGELSCAQEE